MGTIFLSIINFELMPRYPFVGKVFFHIACSNIRMLMYKHLIFQMMASFVILLEQ